jgi:hypothetical protein
MSLPVEPSLSIEQFCEAEGISLSSYYGLRRAGNAPAEIRLPNSRIIRITAAARTAWHARMSGQHRLQQRQLERRRAQNRIAGRAGNAGKGRKPKARTRQRG